MLFRRVSTPGGQRFPAATEAINQSIFKGTISNVTYLGHGGSKGWAQERVLNISDILNWENFDRNYPCSCHCYMFISQDFDDAGFHNCGRGSFIK